MHGKPLIVGANGQLGAAMVRHLDIVHGPDSSIPSGRTAKSGLVQLDLEELHSVNQAAQVLDHLPLSSILCTAGYTWVDGAEDAPERAFQVNTLAPIFLAQYARQRDVPFVCFSTDYVFAGCLDAAGPYRETDSTHALNVYGKSKLQSEQDVLAANSEALVVRTTVVYGEDAQQKNYLYTVLRTLSRGEVLRVPQDQISTPTYNVDLAQAVFALMNRRARGIYHVAGPEVSGRLEFARQIARTFDLDETLLVGIDTAALHQRANRPLRAGLLIDKLLAECPNVTMRPLHEALADCREIFDDAIKVWKTQ